MTDRQLAFLAGGIALLALLVIVLTAHAMRARRDRLARRLDEAVTEERHHPGDDLMALADAVAVHPQCRRWYRAGFDSHVHRACLEQLRREDAR